ncbi:MAG TPA: type II toxin-antitoxin system RelE/ParE family toxin [Pirellulaceae bacterium]
MTLRFTPRARDDLREIMDYIAKDNPVSADKVRQAISNACALIAARPHLGIRNARAPELRSRLVTRFPYRIHYFVENADVWIVHIRHSARRPLDQ